MKKKRNHNCGSTSPIISELHRLAPTALAAALLALGVGPVRAAVTGGEIIAGNGRIEQPNANTTDVYQNSNRLVVQWDRFNVGQNDSVNFHQPSSSAFVLNQILDANASVIRGQINANGNVILVNSSGVYFSETARVNVGSLVASSHQLSVDDFMAGYLKFERENGSSGRVINRGILQAATGGSITLLGSSVENTGQILAQAGRVNLAVGERVTLDFDGDGLMRFVVDEALLDHINGVDSAILNSGQIQAQGGSVFIEGRVAQDVFSRVVNNEGIIQAGRIDNSGGVIRLTGSGGNESAVVNTGQLDASAQDAVSNGGQILLQADNGTLLVSGNSQITANSGNQQGGQIHLLGDQIGLSGNSQVDASGATGGGEILIGGDYQGNNPDIPNADKVIITRDVNLKADATENGDGGRIIVWADDWTRFAGSLSARGGELGGNGGFAEVSGKNNLAYSGIADLRAPLGETGTLLLDPENINIVSAIPDPLPVDGVETTDTDISFEDDPDQDYFILNSTINAQTANVVLQATNNITQTVGADINLGLANDGTTPLNLTFQAGGTITINAAITTQGGKIHLEADSPDSTDGAADGIGNLIITSTGSLDTTAGGADGADITLIFGDQLRTDSAINAGNGDIFVARSQNGSLNIENDDDAGHMRADQLSHLQTSSSLWLGLATTAGIDGNGTDSVDLTTTHLSLNDDLVLASNQLGSLQLIAAEQLDLNGNLDVADADLLVKATDISLSADISTSGNQTYQGRTTLGDDISLTGNDLTLSNDLDGATHNLDITGNLILQGATTDLDSLVIDGNLELQNTASITNLGGLDVSGTSSLGGNVSTSGNQTYTGAVTLTNDVSLVTTNSDITFAGSINGNLADTHSLTLNAGTGNISFEDAVGGVARLAALDITGILNLDQDISTSGNQTYNNAVTLNDDVTLTGSNITFVDTLDGDSHSLTTQGNLELQNTASITNLGSLNVSGTSSLGGNITTSGNQLYQGDVILTNDISLVATDNDITFNAGIDGAQALSLDVGSGNLTLDGNAGDNTALTSLSATAGTISLGGAVTTSGALQLTTSAGSITGATLTGGSILLNANGNLGTNAANRLITRTNNLIVQAGGSAWIDSQATDAAATTQLAGNATNAFNLLQNLGHLAVTTLTQGSTTQTGITAASITLATTGTAADLVISENLSATGSISLTATGDLSTSGNGSLISTGSGNLSLSAANLTLGTSLTSTDGDILLTTDGHLALDDGSITAGGTGSRITLDAASATQDANHDGLIASQLQLLGGTAGNFLLDNSNNAIGLLAADLDGNLTLRNSVDLTLGSVNGTSGIRTGAFNLTQDAGNLQVTQAVTATSLNWNLAGDLTLTEALSVTGGDINITAAGGLLNNHANAVISTDDGNINLVASTFALQLGEINANGGNLKLEAITGSINQDSGHGGLKSNRLLVILRGTGNVSLGAASNSISRLEADNGDGNRINGDFTLTNAGDLNLGSEGGTDGIKAGNIDITTTGLLQVDAALDANGDLVLSGNIQLGADITSTGSQTYNGTATLLGNITLTGDDITFTDSLDGNNYNLSSQGHLILQDTLSDLGNLEITGNLTLENTASITNVGTLSVSGTSSLGGNITTSGSQTYTGAVTLTNHVALTTTNSNISFGSTLDGTHNLTLNTGTGTITFDGAVGDTAQLAALTITGQLNLNQDISTAGDQTYSGALTLTGDRTLTGANIVFASNVTGDGSDLTITGDLALQNTASITNLDTLSVSGTSSLGGNITTTGSQTYTGAVTLANNVSLTANDSDIGFGSTINGPHSLTLNAGTGALTLNGVVGTNALSSLNATASDINLGRNITTSGNQTYTGAVTLTNNVVLTTTNSNINFASSINGDTANSRSLTLNTGTSTITFNGAIGDTARLAALTVTGQLNLNQNISTAGNQTYNSAITLSGDRTLTGSNIVFANDLTGDGGDLTITGNLNLQGTTTGIDALITSGNLLLQGNANLGSLSVTGTSSLGGNIITTGHQTYGGLVTLTGTAGELRTLTAASGQLVSMTGGLDGNGLALAIANANWSLGTTGADNLASLAVGGSSTLAGNVTTTGNQTYTDAVSLSGGNRQLSGTLIRFDSTLTGSNANLGITGNMDLRGTASNIGNLSVSGTSILAANVTTSGSQTYTGAVTLAGGNITHSLSASSVIFGTTVDATTAGTEGLSIVGNASFGGAVGSTRSLSTLSISGTSSLGGNTTTSGSQSYTGAVTLTDNVTLTTTNSNISFASSINGDTANSRSLTLNVGTGTITFNGTVGNTARLAALTVTGQLNLNQNISTSGNQTYNSGITLTGDRTLTGSNITFASNLNGNSNDLNITGNLTLQSTASITNVDALNVSGTSSLGGNITTTGSQTYTGAVSLTNHLSLTASAHNITFDSTLNGAYNLDLNAGNADVIFSNTIGATTALTGLNITAGNIQVASGVTTQGHQTYDGQFILTGDAQLRSGNGNFNFVQAIDGQNFSLELLAGTGNITLHEATNLSDLILTSANNINLQDNIQVNDGRFEITQATGQTQLSDNKKIEANHILLNTTSLILGTGTTLDTSQQNDGSIQIFTDDFQASGTLSLISDLLMLASQDRSKTLYLCQPGSCGTPTPGAVVYSLTPDINITASQLHLGSQVIGQQHQGDILLVGLNIQHDLNVTTSQNGNIEVLNGYQGSGSLILNTETGGQIKLHNGNITTQDNLTFNGAVELQDSLTLTSTSGNIHFADTINGLTAGNQSLTLSASQGNIRLDDILGGNQRLKDLTILDAVDSSFSTLLLTGDFTQQSGSGTTTLNSAIEADNIWLEVDSLSLASGVNLDTSNTGGNITLFVDNLLTIGSGTQINAGTGRVSLAPSTTTNTLHICSGGSCTGTFDTRYNLGDLSINAAEISFGRASHQAAITLEGISFDYELQVLNNADILVRGALDGTIGGRGSLVLDAGSGKALLQGNITTSGRQLYNSEVQLAGNLQLKTENSDITFTGLLTSTDGNAFNLVLDTGTDINDSGDWGIFFEGQIQRINNLTITQADNVTLGGEVYLNGSFTLQSSSGTLALAEGLKLTAADIEFNAQKIEFADGGDIQLITRDDGNIDLITDELSILGTLSVHAGNGTITLAPQDITTKLLVCSGASCFGLTPGAGEAIYDIGEGFTFNNDATFQVGQANHQGNITLYAFAPAYDLALTNTGSARIDLVGAFNSDFGLALNSGSGGIHLAADVTTQGNQVYNGTVILGSNLSLTARDSSNQNQSIHFSESVNSESGQAYQLTLNGNSTFEGDIGTAINGQLGSLTVNGTTWLGADVITSGNQTYNGTTTLSGDRDLQGNLIRFNDTLTGDASDLSITGDLHLQGTASNIGNLLVSGTALLGADITTDGNQTYQDSVILANNITLTSGNTVTFDSTLNGGGNSLSIDGDLDLQDAASNISNLQVSGTTNLAANVTTSGNQTYSGTTTLSGDRNLQGSLIHFNDTLTGDTSDLTISGNLNLQGTASNINDLQVSGTTTLGADITTSGNQTYTGQVILTGTPASIRTLTADSGQTILMTGGLNGGGLGLYLAQGNWVLAHVATSLTSLRVADTANLAASITTSGDQTYQSSVTLGNNLLLTAATIIFESTLQGAGRNLIINGNLNLQDTASSINNLQVSGTTTLGADLTTSGNQAYTGQVILTGTPGSIRTLAAGSGQTITMTGGLNGGGLDLELTQGNWVLGNAATNLANLSVSGTTTLSGNITTSGNQTYQGGLTLNNGTRTLTGNNITFEQGINGPGALAITATNNITFNGAVGGTNRLASLALNATSIQVNGGRLSTSGNQTYLGALTTSGNTQIESSSGNITFNQPVQADNNLQITGNTLTFGDLTANGALALTARNNFSHAAGTRLAAGGTLTLAVNQAGNTQGVTLDLNTLILDSNSILLQGSGHDTLRGHDGSNNSWEITSNGSGNLTYNTGTESGNLTFSDFAHLLGGNGNETFTVTGNHTGSIQGQGGNDVIRLQGNGRVGQINGGSGSNTLDVSGTNSSMALVLNEGFSNIQTLIGSGDSLQGISSGNSIWQLNSSSGGSLNGITFTGFTQLISGTGGTNTFTTNGNYQGGIQLAGRNLWHYTSAQTLTSGQVTGQGLLTILRQDSLSGAGNILIGANDLRLPSLQNYLGTLLIGAEFTGNLLPLNGTTQLIIRTNRLTLSEDVRTGGNLILVAGDININTPQINAGGSVHLLATGNCATSACGPLSGQNIGNITLQRASTITGSQGQILAANGVMNASQLTVDFAGGDLELAVSSEQQETSQPGLNSNVRGVELSANTQNFIQNVLGLNLVGITVTFANPAASMLGVRAVEVIDIALFEEDLTLFGRLGEGVALAFAQCEEVEGCTPNVTAEELTASIDELQLRIQQLESELETTGNNPERQQALQALLNDYRSQQEEFIAYRNDLQDFTGFEQQFEDEFGNLDDNALDMAALEQEVALIETIYARVRFLENLQFNRERRNDFAERTGMDLNEERLAQIIDSTLQAAARTEARIERMLGRE